MPAPGFAASSPVIDWGVSWRALPGQRESGDLHVVCEFENGILIGVVDGLGHGPEAAAAARAAAEVLQSHAGEPVIALVKHCHEGLRKTRGVVLSIASLDATERMMSWIAVGNVEGVLFRADRAARPARETVLMRSGVVGYQLPPLRAALHPLQTGDLLIFATDGIKDAFTNQPPLSVDPQEAATEILNRFGKDSDDALVLVARWRGIPP
jgi:hypothetical protein